MERVLVYYYEGHKPTPERIDDLGAGWIAEEALAIGIWCALTATSFEQGVINAVNHSGDSDSTGLIASQLPTEGVRQTHAHIDLKLHTDRGIGQTAANHRHGRTQAWNHTRQRCDTAACCRHLGVTADDLLRHQRLNLMLRRLRFG